MSYYITTRYLIAVGAALVAASALAFFARGAGAQQATFVIDAGPAGNEPVSIGEIEDCVEVSTGDQFEMDVLVQDISDLLAWELFIDYDPEVVIVINQDVKLFQEANEGSAVLDLSAAVPDDSGFHSLAALDSSDPAQPDSGSGVLARVTFEAVGPGESTIGIGDLDINSDGKIDRGTLLRDRDAEPIGDEDGDNFFDGEVTDASVAVDGDCPPGSTVAEAEVTTASPSPPASTPGDGPSNNDDDSFPWAIVAAAVAAGVVVVGGLGALLVRGRKPGAPPPPPGDPMS